MTEAPTRISSPAAARTWVQGWLTERDGILADGRDGRDLREYLEAIMDSLPGSRERIAGDPQLRAELLAGLRAIADTELWMTDRPQLIARLRASLGAT